MVKPDASKDYYAILDIKSDAGTDEIKKAYHKLALKWHPDRNHGSESEASMKFQDISAAYDILIEPSTRAKYDADRLRLQGRYASAFTSPTSNVPNPYKSWPRPTQPPRPQPTQSGQPNNMKSPTSGQEQYARWTANTGPWGESTAGGPQSRADAAHTSKAWAYMTKGSTPGRGATRPDRGSQAPRGGPPQPPPNMPPRGRPPRPNTFAHTSGNAGPQPTPKARAGWDDLDNSAPVPGMTRSKTMRTPKKGGFDPGMHDGDEPPARNTSAYSHMHRGSVPHAAKPQPFQQRPTQQPGSRRPEMHKPDPFKGFRSPRSEENINDRLSTPYATSGGEKTYFSSEGLSRNPSSGSASNLRSGWEEAFGSAKSSPRSPNHERHRSASPRMRSPNPQPSSSSDESSVEEVTERVKLRPRGVASRTAAANGSPQEKNMPPPPKPSVTVENPDGETFEFSKPTKRSTWSADSANADQGQPEKLSPNDAAFRRTSTGDLAENIRLQHAHRSSRGARPPSPLQTATPLTNDDDEFEPLEKTASWQENFGFKKDAPGHRHFDPPNGSGLQSNYFPANTSPGSTSPTKDTPDRSASQFSQHDWQQKFSNDSANPFHPPPTLGAETRGRASPMKTRPTMPTKTPRKMSAASKRPTFPKPASVSAASSNSDEELARASSANKTSSSTERSSSSSAMDIDSSTPPHKVSEMKSTHDPLGQAIRAQAPNKTPTGSTAPSPALKPNTDNAHLNMKDFAKTAPFSSSNSNGISDLGDIGSNLPFQSAPAATLPTVDIHPHNLKLPPAPDPPKPPNLLALKKNDLEYYMVFVRKYMAEWNMFNHQMLGHFNARQVMVETALPKNWLDGVGITGCSKYLAWMQEDTKVRAHWDTCFEKHIEIMSTLEHVKKAVATGKFVG